MSDEFTFYDPISWRKICSIYHRDALLVLDVGSNNLYDLLSDTKQLIIFDDLIRSLGFYYQLGRPGCIGFHALENFNYADAMLAHNLLYSHEKWHRKKKLILTTSRHRCQYCFNYSHLSVYNGSLKNGHAPWEYPLDYFRVLCDECLTLHVRVETIFRAFIPDLESGELRKILDRLHPSFDWYHPDNIGEYVDTIWPLIPHSIR